MQAALEPFVKPLVVGLCGGIASGKSTVAARFVARGFALVDADAIAREVVREAAVATAIRERFGTRAFGADGELDRAWLAGVVFADPHARRDLESITHPAIRARIEDQIEAARAARRPLLLDVPLLVEGGLGEGGLIERCDAVVFVDTPPDRRADFAAARGWQPDELARREAAQAPLSVKAARATATIANRGALEDTFAQVDRLLTTWAEADRAPRLAPPHD